MNTITLRNCSHLNTGWCLSCVMDQFREHSKEIKELENLLLTPKQLYALAVFIEKKPVELYNSLLQELTPKYLRDKAKEIKLFGEE